ncbi:unnamed protein product [Strongylus vulgaris]|uniref:Uncharacterized protein n=1 Tax=Strongylus vulgaris TaxID=40348 RepID=A0A3P7LVU8_STRVU|nr:unnamed protein product [Strongylus vulgaris]
MKSFLLGLLSVSVLVAAAEAQSVAEEDNGRAKRLAMMPQLGLGGGMRPGFGGGMRPGFGQGGMRPGFGQGGMRPGFGQGGMRPGFGGGRPGHGFEPWMGGRGKW